MRIFEADFEPDLLPGNEDVIDLLAHAGDETGDLPIVPDSPATIAAKYYH